VACTGNTGCKFANADTKGAAEIIAAHVESRLDLDQPVNIHITGCPHSCAQHYIGDIGLVACKIDRDGDAEPVEGFHIIIGGASGEHARIGREIYRNIEKQNCPRVVETLLGVYLAHRASQQESFIDFANRHDVETLRVLAEETP
jgi:ferredoxin-nitrite reductase